MPKRLLLGCSLVVGLALSGCGGGGDQTKLPPAPGGGPAGGGAPPPAATATLSGKIMFQGTPPAPQKIQMSADPYCVMNNKDPKTEDVVASDGGLQNVMIYVSSPVQGSFPTPTEAVTIDQHDCHYIPHVFTMQANQPLKIKNSDTTLHNIHAYPMKNEGFNVGQPVKDMITEKKFTMAETPIPFKCEVHRWMGAYVGVFTHPYHTVSKEGGAYELKLAPGMYEITAWHELYGSQKQMVEVKDGEKTELNFMFMPTKTSD